MEVIAKKITSSFLAGAYIALGALCCSLTESKTVGAIFFTAGILLVFNFNKMLYTRVVPMFVLGDYKVRDMFISFFGNALGGFSFAFLISLTRLFKDEGLSAKIDALSQIKSTDNLLSLFILGIFAAMMVGYGAMSLRKYNENPVTSVFFCILFVALFIICGFEHVVANFFYFSFFILKGNFSLNILTALLVVGIGNFLGGIFIGVIKKYTE